MNWKCSVAAAAALFTSCAIAAAAAPEKQGGKTLRVYHIGNSVTDTIHYRSLQQMAASDGNAYTFGRHMISGAPLQYIWDHPTSGFKEKPYGYYPTALADFDWDVITLQPFDRQLDSPDGFGDLPHAKKFIDLAIPKSPDVQVYIYERWPRRKEKEKKNPAAGYAPFDYEKLYLRKYNAGKWDGTYETRDYFQRLTLALREAYPKLKPVLIVPVGDVLLELDRRAKAGKVPELDTVQDLFVDGIHFNNMGAFIVGTTFYSTMFKTDPRGADARPYQPGKSDKDRQIEPKTARAIQEAVWDVVSKHEFAGVRDAAAAAPAAAKEQAPNASRAASVKSK
jgi:hypothetical protein